MHGNELTFYIIWIAFIIGTSQFFSFFLRKFSLPNVLGELLLGILFASFIYLIPSSEISTQLLTLKKSIVMDFLGELGVILLLLKVGLETELDKVIKVGKESFLVAAVGVLAPFALSFLSNTLFHLNWSLNVTLFVGLVLAATSIGVTARVFQDLGMMHRIESQIVLGAAVLDDVIGLIMLSIIAALVQSAGATPMEISLIILKALGFLGVSAILGTRFGSNLIDLGNYLAKGQMNIFVSLVIAFTLLCSYLASLAGLAMIVGAFAAGIILDRIKIKEAFGGEKTIEELIDPIICFLSPIFFVKVGMAIDPTQIFSVLALLLTFIACVSKLISGWSLLENKFNKLLIGVGMMPRGEVGLVVVAIGVEIGLLKQDLMSTLIFAVVMTTLIAPLWLKLILRQEDKRNELASQ
jgi:Kef-type K+ transport system membrane component KefB